MMKAKKVPILLVLLGALLASVLLLTAARGRDRLAGIARFVTVNQAALE